MVNHPLDDKLSDVLHPHWVLGVHVTIESPKLSLFCLCSTSMLAASRNSRSGTYYNVNLRPNEGNKQQTDWPATTRTGSRVNIKQHACHNLALAVSSVNVLLSTTA
jgi:hypothetical protein